MILWSRYNYLCTKHYWWCKTLVLLSHNVLLSRSRLNICLTTIQLTYLYLAPWKNICKLGILPGEVGQPPNDTWTIFMKSIVVCNFLRVWSAQTILANADYHRNCWKYEISKVLKLFVIKPCDNSIFSPLGNHTLSQPTISFAYAIMFTQLRRNQRLEDNKPEFKILMLLARLLKLMSLKLVIRSKLWLIVCWRWKATRFQIHNFSCSIRSRISTESLSQNHRYSWWNHHVILLLFLRWVLASFRQRKFWKGPSLYDFWKMFATWNVNNYYSNLWTSW